MLPELRSSCPETSLRPREETLAGMSPRQPEGVDGPKKKGRGVGRRKEKKTWWAGWRSQRLML